MNNKAAVIGLGYVGLPLAIEMSKKYQVIGIDIDKNKVAELNSGNSYINDVTDQEVQEAIKRGFFATTEYEILSTVKYISICVPTPLRKTKDPDMSYILSAVKEISKYLQKGQVIVLESTTYPGATEEIILPCLVKKDMIVGRDFFLAFSPERVDPGNKKFRTKNIPKIIGGVTEKCTSEALAFYSSFLDRVIPVSSARVAEMVKLLENTFRAVNIGMVNEMAMMCERMGIDIWEVIDAAATKPFGFMPFYPGPGIGGHCIPLDPIYLSWKAKSFNFYNRFIDLATDINSNMPRYTVNKLMEILNSKGIPILGSKILVLGIAYKRDVNDWRESPSIEIIKLLIELGAKVSYFDPYVPQCVVGNEKFSSINLDYSKLQYWDCVLLLTDHSCYDYDIIAKNARLIFDTRNAFKKINNLNIIKLGASYVKK
ncbi:MAG: nucleotide sugar dehydrogenase [Clostridia bacterium]|nr:nucleotide sugar dehydrogenase [Clostridia bacterium]